MIFIAKNMPFMWNLKFKVNLWRSHFELVILRINSLAENSFGFELNDQVYESTLHLIKNLNSFIGNETEVLKYRHIYEESLIRIYNNSNLIQTNEQFKDIFSVLKV